MASNTMRATSGAKNSLSPRSGARIPTFDSTRLTPWASVFRPPGFGNAQTLGAGASACQRAKHRPGVDRRKRLSHMFRPYFAPIPTSVTPIRINVRPASFWRVNRSLKKILAQIMVHT